jgi:hypothetical protein
MSVNNTTDAAGQGVLLNVLERSRDLKLEDFSIGRGPLIALAIAAWFVLSAYTRPVREIAGAQTSGRRSPWEPDFWLFWRYTANARQFIDDGVKKVCKCWSNITCAPYQHASSSKAPPSSSSAMMSTSMLCH